ncbi:MAG: sugar ABC transporter substrate-binding protein, partial [bacterium]
MAKDRAKALLAVSMLAVSAMAAVGCGGGDGGGSKKIAAVLYSRDVPYYQAIGEGIQQQADDYGWDVNINYTQPDPSAAADGVNTAAVQNPDGIIIDPIDPSALIPATKQALGKGIPVVALGDDLADPSARTTYVGGDFVDYGRTKAQWIVDQLNGQGNVGIVHGIRGITFTEDQNMGATEVFAKNPGIHVVDGPYAGNFTADVGLSATQNLLTANPNLDAIFFDNDDLALGGAQAAQDRGLNNVLIVGTDGLAAGLAGLEKRQIDYTRAQCAVDQGRAAVRALNDQFENGSVDARIVT